MAKVSVKRHTSYTRQGIQCEDNQPSIETHIGKKHKTFLPPGKGLIKSQSEAATYIADMLAILRNIAKDVDLKFLNYLLEMAYEESLSHANKAPEAIKRSSR